MNPTAGANLAQQANTASGREVTRAEQLVLRARQVNDSLQMAVDRLAVLRNKINGGTPEKGVDRGPVPVPNGLLSCLEVEGEQINVKIGMLNELLMEIERNV